MCGFITVSRVSKPVPLGAGFGETSFHVGPILGTIKLEKWETFARHRYM
jgi:hypothetical protein